MSPKGQHIELGIAEMNLFLNLAALGLSHSLFGERLIPIGTLYDPFIMRGLDALNYACYQDARFIVVATPSGLTLAPEGGAHQSIATPLIGMAQDGLAAFEPAYVDELAVIMDWAFRYLQRDGIGELPEHEKTTRWLRDEKGGSVYLRLSTRGIAQPTRAMTPQLREDIIQGGYWLRKPDAGTGLAIVAMGAVMPEAIEAAGLLAEDRRGVGVLAVTSADRLSAGWHGAQRARERGDRARHRPRRASARRSAARRGHHHGVRRASRNAVVDRRRLPAIACAALGPEHFGQSGNLARTLCPLRPRRERHAGRGRRACRAGGCGIGGEVMSVGV